MNREEERLDPEAILKAIERNERQEKNGKLRIFFGMAAGVGKTFAMLREAGKKLADGVDVIVGIVETHGRRETQVMLEGLPSVPLRKVDYKNTILYEMDLESILKRKPQLVLVDELAHSNAPGSRHPKRWQDVVELLDAGIDVYTTINVQHIESRKALIEEITSIMIRETVPDSLIERANAIELIDITPQELLSRLKEGKVYLGPQAQIAILNFFQEDRLTALREVALRLTAEKVDHDLHDMLSTVIEGKEGWRPAEKLMVAVSPSPYSQQLIRATRRFAFNLDCPWLAVHVDDGRYLTIPELQMLAENITLARELGAEIITTRDPDIPQAIQRIAKQKNITQIILGRAPKWQFSDLFSGGTLLDYLSAEAIDMDLHVMRRQELHSAPEALQSKYKFRHCSDYLLTLGIVTSLTIAGWMIDPLAGHEAVGVTYLIGIMLMALFFEWKPVILAAIVSGCIWNFLFLSVFKEINTIELKDLVLPFIYISTVLIMGTLTSRIRSRERLLRHNEEQTQMIYEIVRVIASSPSTESLLPIVEEKLSKILTGDCKIAIKSLNNQLELDPTAPLFKGPKEIAVALWSFENEKPAGWSTATLSSVGNLYMPIRGFEEVVGIFVYHPKEINELSIEMTNLLHTVLQQCGIYIERSLAEEKQRHVDYAKQIEGLRYTILNSISKQFHKPLTSIQIAAEKLKEDTQSEEAGRSLQCIQEIEESSENINRIVNAILTMSQLKTDFMVLQKEKHSVAEMMDNCVLYLKKALVHHNLVLGKPQKMVEGFFDLSLIELMLCNLLLNSIEYAPMGTEILFECHPERDGFLFSISDERSPIDEVEVARILERPYHTVVGVHQEIGLEWLVAKAIIEKHEGWMTLSNLPGKGIISRAYVPCSEKREMPALQAVQGALCHPL